jgi:hypothetical protein
VLGLGLLAVCGCSDYFTPWTAFNVRTYNGTEVGFPMDATPFTVGDSIEATVNSVGASWYSFAAAVDTVYVFGFYPNFDGKLEVIDSSSGVVVLSFPDSSQIISGRFFWTCAVSGTYYLHIRDVSDSYNSGAQFGLLLKQFGAAYASLVDSFEPDSAKALASVCPVTIAGAPELFQFRRLTPLDTDWILFAPNSSHTYTIRALGGVRTRICLMTPDGDSVIACDDSSGAGKNAQLIWPCPYLSSFVRYYLRVTGAAPNASGVYAVSIRESSY